nr:uncharacterized protein LOC113697911 isoform X1 [Coffea arabica]XP_027076788.1 uncharacterized protein LOC113700504 isoform X1 [Coffea arabica]
MLFLLLASPHNRPFALSFLFCYCCCCSSLPVSLRQLLLSLSCGFFSTSFLFSSHITYAAPFQLDPLACPFCFPLPITSETGAPLQNLKSAEIQAEKKISLNPWKLITVTKISQ